MIVKSGVGFDTGKKGIEVFLFLKGEVGETFWTSMGKLMSSQFLSSLDKSRSFLLRCRMMLGCLRKMSTWKRAPTTPVSHFDRRVFLEDSYNATASNLEVVRKNLGRPLTFAEKIVFGHLEDPATEIVRGQTYLKLRPDRVAMQVR